MPLSLTFDVTPAAGTGEPLTQAAWVFLPRRPTHARAALLCLAGGTYDKHYWHIEIDGHPGYSFGEHLAAAGYIVIALDHLGVGESSDECLVWAALQRISGNGVRGSCGAV